MYCDNIRGIFPLLTFPDESIKSDEKKMAPINFHPIWSLSTKTKSESGYINLIYRGNIYIAKKYHFFTETEGRESYYLEPNFEKIVSILVLPKKMNFFRKVFLKIVLENTIQEYIHFFHKIVSSEILKQDLIKIPKNKSIIREGEFVKESIKNLLIDIFLEQKQDLEQLKSSNLNLEKYGTLY